MKHTLNKTKNAALALVCLTALKTAAGLDTSILTILPGTNAADDLAYLGDYSGNPALAIAGHNSPSYIYFLDKADGTYISKKEIPNPSQGGSYFGSSVAPWRGNFGSNPARKNARGLVIGSYSSALNLYYLDESTAEPTHALFLSNKDARSLLTTDMDRDGTDDVIVLNESGLDILFVDETTPGSPSLKLPSLTFTIGQLGILDRKGFSNGICMMEDNVDNILVAIGGGKGIIWILSITKDSDPDKITPTLEATINHFETTFADTQFGYGLAYGDIYGDGTKQLIIGASSYPRTDPPVRPHSGAIVVVWFDPGWVVRDFQLHVPDRPNWSVTDRFGISIELIDLDDDTRHTPEIAVGCASLSGASHVVIFDEVYMCATQDDADGDDVRGACDKCPDTEPNETVNADGCSIAQLCPCVKADKPWTSHRRYVRCVKDAANDFVMSGLISLEDKQTIVSEAQESNCGRNAGSTSDSNDSSGSSGGS